MRAPPAASAIRKLGVRDRAVYHPGICEGELRVDDGLSVLPSFSTRGAVGAPERAVVIPRDVARFAIELLAAHAAPGSLPGQLR